MRSSSLFLSVCLFSALGSPLLAQDVPDPDANARIHLGPVSLSPTIALTNIGRDDNVFYQPDQLTPKSDFTVTLTPATDVWMRLGRTWFIGAVREDLVYYQTYASERSANTTTKLGWLVPLNRITFNVNGAYLSTRDRPGYEIDARSQRTEKGGDGSIEIRALSKTFFGIKGATKKVDFDSVATFEGVNLGLALNRTINTGGISARHQLTPLTSLTFEVTREQERFVTATLRDSDSTRIVGGVKFEPFALIKGSATVGYRSFHPLAAGVPDYQGTTANVDLTYVALGSTKFGVQGYRDVQYSFEVNQPYYVQTGGTANVSQQIYGPFDVTARYGMYQLDYRNRAGTDIAVQHRTDLVHIYGGGAGYRLGKDMRVGFNIEQQTRTSDVTLRGYNGLRFGFSVTYGS